MATEKSWQARIGEATDRLAEAFVESISYDHRLYKHDIAGSIAHARMLASTGLITVVERDQIIDGLSDIERDLESGQLRFDASLEDIHMAIEANLIERIGEPGRKLHTARSRNDQVALDLLLWIDEANGTIDQRLTDLCRALVELAERSMDIVMPAYTHLQRAQPICAAAEALAWCAMLAENCNRAGRFARKSMTSPLGSGAIAGSSLPIDPADTAAQLGMFGPPASSIEMTASRDVAIEFVFHLSMIAMHLSRWAEQWIIYSSSEFSFIQIADRFTTGSSMMPQKRNPDMLELIRGRCGNVYGSLVALLTILKGLPIGYNRDLQEDKRHVFAAFDVTSASLAMAAAIVSSARYVRANIEPSLDRGFLDATSLAEYFVRQGIAFRTAHQIVGQLVRRCEAEGKRRLADLKLEEIAATVREHAPGAKIDSQLFESLGPANVVRRYQSAGAAGGEPLRKQLAEMKKRLGM